MSQFMENIAKFENPSDYINYINRRNLSEKSMIECLQSLKTTLKDNSSEWIKDFGKIGISAIITALNENRGRNDEIELECIKCLYAIMNNTVGVELAFACPTIWTTLTQSLDHTKPYCMIEAVKILAASCLITNGFKKVLDGLTIVNKNNNRNRFSSIIQGLKENSPETLKVHCMLLINAIIRETDDLYLRVHLRTELNKDCFHNLLDELKIGASEAMQIQMNVFENALKSDDEEITPQSGIVRAETKTVVVDDVNHDDDDKKLDDARNIILRLRSELEHLKNESDCKSSSKKDKKKKNDLTTTMFENEETIFQPIDDKELIQHLDDGRFEDLFENMLNELNMPEENRSIFRKLSRDEKTKMLLLHHGTNINEGYSNFETPKDYITYLNKSKLSTQKIVDCLKSLRITLMNKSLLWMEDFGIEVIQIIISKLNEHRGGDDKNSAVEIECLRCLHAIIKNPTVTKDVFACLTFWSDVVKSLNFAKPSCMMEAAKILSVACSLPGGLIKILEALTVAKEQNKRLSSIKQGLEEGASESLKVQCMQLINSILMATDDLALRIHLRTEFKRDGFMPIIANLKNEASSALMSQLDIFENAIKDDQENLKNNLDNMKFDMDNIDCCYQALKTSTANTAAEASLLSILQNLLFIRNERMNNLEYYKVIEACVTQIVLYKDGCDPDFAATTKFQIDVESVIEEVARKVRSEGQEHYIELKSKLDEALSNIESVVAAKEEATQMKQRALAAQQEAIVAKQEALVAVKEARTTQLEYLTAKREIEAKNSDKLLVSQVADSPHNVFPAPIAEVHKFVPKGSPVPFKRNKDFNNELSTMLANRIINRESSPSQHGLILSRSSTPPLPLPRNSGSIRNAPASPGSAHRVIEKLPWPSRVASSNNNDKEHSSWSEYSRSDVPLQPSSPDNSINDGLSSLPPLLDRLPSPYASLTESP